MNRAGRTVYPILLMVCATHLLNDMMQSVIPAVYPLLKEKFGFTFAQIGLITLVFQLTSSLLQPVAGRLADLHPRPYSLAVGMCFTLCGLLALAAAPGFSLILVSVGLIGCGSSVFHPESSRVAQLASGGRKGLAQSIFQVGGNAGSALGPLLAALIVIPFGQASIGWFALAALLAIFILVKIGNWYKRQVGPVGPQAGRCRGAAGPGLSKRKIRNALLILGVLVFSKYFYIASMTNYFTFFLMEKFSMSVQGAQYALSRSSRLRRRGFHRRSGRRPHRAQIRDLGLDPRRGSLYADASLCRSDRDHRAGRRHRTGHLVGFLGHSGLCHRPDARQGRHDRRVFFGLMFRTGRPRLGLFRVAGRPDEHRIHLPGQHSAALLGVITGFFAEHRIEKR